MTSPIVIGIETSCDETGIGIVSGTTLLAHQVASSMDEHVAFGGVIPEIAARAHVTEFLPVLEAALAEANITLDDVDAIAVTAGPGLAGALMVGVAGAKALAVATGKPLYGINHLLPLAWVFSTTSALTSTMSTNSVRCSCPVGTLKC